MSAQERAAACTLISHVAGAPGQSERAQQQAAQLFCHAIAAGVIAFEVHQKHEFIAAGTRNEIVGADRLRKTQCDFLQQHVASAVPQTFIDIFEAIQIK